MKSTPYVSKNPFPKILSLASASSLSSIRQTKGRFYCPVCFFSTAYLLTPVIRLICLIDNPPSFSAFMHLFRSAISSFRISDALLYPHTCFMISLASLSFILLFYSFFWLALALLFASTIA